MFLGELEAFWGGGLPAGLAGRAKPAPGRLHLLYDGRPSRFSPLAAVRARAKTVKLKLLADLDHRSWRRRRRKTRGGGPAAGTQSVREPAAAETRGGEVGEVEVGAVFKWKWAKWKWAAAANSVTKLFWSKSQNFGSKIAIYYIKFPKKVAILAIFTK